MKREILTNKGWTIREVERGIFRDYKEDAVSFDKWIKYAVDQLEKPEKLVKAPMAEE
jgi:hypothetical protein